jgi:hypothetical protein
MAIAAAALLAALAAGCGSSSPPTASAAADKTQNIAVDAYKYSACMRAHGVTNFPDPQVSTSPGHVAIRQMVPSGVAQSPQFKSAQKSCQSIMPGAGNINPAQVAQQQQAHKQVLLTFVRCLRSHGLPDFPDPNSQGQLTPQMISAAGIDLHQPAVLTAGKECVGVTHGAITVAQVEAAIAHGG